MNVTIPIFNTTGGFLGEQVNPIRLINMYVAPINEGQAKVLSSIPGSQVAYTHTGGSRTRLTYTNVNSLFAVYDDDVVIHDTDLNATSIGTLNTTAGYIGVSANNSKQITFVDNVEGWVYDYSGMTPTFTQITDMNFPAQAVDTDFLDGYTIVGQSSSNKWVISDPDDSTTYGALNFARLTSKQDFIVGIRVVNRRIFIFGNRITEIFYNSENVAGAAGGISTFPFVRDDNNVLQYGCAAVKSIAQDENILVWLASQNDGPPSVRYTTGGAAKKISSIDVEYQLQQKIEAGATISDAEGFLYKINGMLFYLLNFIAGNICFVYNFATNKWHQQEMIDGSTYFACCHAYFNSKHYFGHYNAPKLSEVSDRFVMNDLENIHCTLITPIITDKSQQRIECKRLLLECRQGVGEVTTTPQGDGTYSTFGLTPEVYLTISKDGGATYQNTLTKGVGKAGEYEWNTIWNQIGLSRRFVFKLEKFQPFKWIILEATLVAELKGY